ncbi:hypothetical protein OPV22_020069 [Ensete ventricosum]|uniref:Uncharacterized protein n=1 Tax=Ensete ventricosum TaxID=4639 RepID=A0AAV8QKK4_ENSVE|nr:hypothetical protein OPV22_020069 [Ensete ventricosum]
MNRGGEINPIDHTVKPKRIQPTCSFRPRYPAVAAPPFVAFAGIMKLGGLYSTAPSLPVYLRRSEGNKGQKNGIQLREQGRPPRLPPGTVAAGSSEGLVLQLICLRPGGRPEVRVRSGHPRGFLQVPSPQDELPRPHPRLPHLYPSAAAREHLPRSHRGGPVTPRKRQK